MPVEPPVGASCLSCRYYQQQVFRVGVLFTDGKQFRNSIEMACSQRMPAVKELGPCPFYEREPGAD